MSNWHKPYKFQSPRVQMILESGFEDDMEVDRMNNKFKGQKNHKAIIEPTKITNEPGANTNLNSGTNGLARIRKPFDVFPTKDELGDGATDDQKYVAFDCGTSFVHFKHGAGPITVTAPGTQVYLQNCAAGNDPAYDGTTTGLRILNSFAQGVATIFGQAPGISNYNLLGDGNTDGFLYPGRRAKHYTPKDRKPGDVKYIVMHSTDGRSGPGSAQRTIDRFAKGPTLSYTWKNKNTGKEIKNPPCADVLAVDGILPHGTICHPERSKVEKPVKTSIHYAVDQGGTIVQGCEEKDIANHGGAGRNSKSIGIEMCGKPSVGPNKGYLGLYCEMYNKELIETTAKLCAEICKRWNLNPDATTIIGHESFSSSRHDPGSKLNTASESYWDWDDFLRRVQGYHGGGTA